ncbi:hypothetical protein C1645_831913 [Glomus cerebriforme]|uniref:Uncharacterized protein n=1 Tax=Glomus cerebriforme TaxID=658196 RepID=A0A397SIE4_9GLOM|nr:hypothetical protein C1645_831913 [Glomus cerebriforme]
MSSLALFNSSGSMPFLALIAFFLLIGPVLFMGIATMWSNIKQKVSDELYARAIEIVDYLDTPEIEKTFTEFDDKLTAKVDTSISNFKSTFIAEISRIYAEIDGKLTAEAEKIKARDGDFTKEAQKILSMVNNMITRLDNVEEACRNDFASVNASIEALQNGLIQCYTLNRRIQPVKTDQQSVSNHSEASSRSSSSSGPITFKGISLTIWTQFKEVFDKIKAEKRFNLKEMCLHVAMEIRELGGNIKKVTVQEIYERNIKKKDGYISTLDDIGLWLDSKLSVNNNASSSNNNAE